MYGGKIVEECKASELNAARHPYTRALIKSVPLLDRPQAELTVVTRDPEWLA
jgi:peptide/nickel transport system ATP-binding protein